MPKQKKEVIQTNAKVQDGKFTTLEQIWGFNESAKYGTLDESIYASQLDEMNKTDLYEHARKIGVTLVDGVARLKSNLLHEFRSYVAYLNKPQNPNGSHPKISARVERILAEGR